LPAVIVIIYETTQQIVVVALFSKYQLWGAGRNTFKNISQRAPLLFV